MASQIGEATYAEVEAVVDALATRGLLAGGPGVLTAAKREVLNVLAPETPNVYVDASRRCD
jgi:hypothetical protein